MMLHPHVIRTGRCVYCDKRRADGSDYCRTCTVILQFSGLTEAQVKALDRLERTGVLEAPAATLRALEARGIIQDGGWAL